MSAPAARLRLRPMSLREANRFVAAVHRHHGPVRGHKFALAVEDVDGVLRGVAIAGRPVSRKLDTGWRLEVLRVATDGAPNACSMLYAAVARAGVAIGYRRQDILTYTLAAEPGTSLRAAAGSRSRSPPVPPGIDPAVRAATNTPSSTRSAGTRPQRRPAPPSR
jgi:hypothetical protein